MKFKDRTNVRYGRLVAVSRATSTPKVSWVCLCDCGNQVTVQGASLTSGLTQSCGCLRNERVSLAITTHKMSYTPEYHAFKHARDRCINKKNKAYHNYGGRGIAFSYGTINEFIDDIGLKPTPQHSLDRIDVNGHYEPGNCRWATSKVQMLNRRCILVYEHQLISLLGEFEGKNLWNAIRADYKL
jgi:hypothetical protein